MNAENATEMPRYKCHKEVWALKIANVHVLQDGSGILDPFFDKYAAFTVDADYIGKHQPAAGGYYVIYQDGYKSFSPAEAFESGYTLV